MMASQPRKMVLWGGTGHARVLRECMAYHGVSLVAVFDNKDGLPSPFPDVPIYYGVDGYKAWRRNEPEPTEMGFLVAIGGSRGGDRIAIHEMMAQSGLAPLTALHPTAFIAASASIGAGTQVLAHAAVCVDVRLGRDVIVNTAASIDHECSVGDGSHVCPGARLAGSVTLGRCVTVGTGAIILPFLTIGDGATVGAGAVVLHDVPPNQVVVGNPARALPNRSAHGPA